MFTEEETRGLYQKQNALLGTNNALPFSFEDLKSCYNGYTAFDGTMLFNPWAIGQALNYQKLGPYWVASGYDKIIDQRVLDMLRNEDEFRDNIGAMLEGETMTFTVDDNMSYKMVSDMSMSQLWTLIYYTGYLTIAHPENQQEERNNSRTLLVRIPNREIRSVFHGWLESYLRNSIRAQHLDTPSKELFEGMIEGDFSKFADRIRLVSGRKTYRILGGNDAVYQDFLYAFFLALSENHSPNRDNRWKIWVEPDGGMGHLDLVMWHLNDHRAVIHEHRNKRWTAKDKKEGFNESKNRRLTKLSEDGLDQIQRNDYRTFLNVERHITELHVYGIAFWGTWCAVVGRTLPRKRADETWTLTKEYNGAEDEASRAPMYILPVSSS